MEMKSTDLVSLFENALKGLSDQSLQEIGLVIKVGDNICLVHGLKNAIYGELIEFEGGNSGIIFNLDEDSVAIFLLDNTIPVAELEVAKRTNDVFRVPVDTSMLGRVLNAVGKPIDGLGQIQAKEFRPVESVVAGITQRVHALGGERLLRAGRETLVGLTHVRLPSRLRRACPAPRRTPRRAWSAGINYR